MTSSLNRHGSLSARQLENVDRLAAIGQFTTEIAHELNGPLDGVLRYINLTLRLLDRDQKDRSKEYLLRSREGVLRIATIVSELLENARIQEFSSGPVSLEQIVKHALEMANARPHRASVKVSLDLKDQILTTRQGDLAHVFSNIVDNAFDAMPGGGRLAISSHTEADGHWVIRFKDSGCGLPVQPSDRIFQSFFTTKENGTGLGLAICKDIVDRLQGQISAKNNRSKGATITVRIPMGAIT